jgi:hypothetical protein
MILLAFFTPCCAKHRSEWLAAPEKLVSPANPVQQRGDFATIHGRFNEW